MLYLREQHFLKFQVPLAELFIPGADYEPVLIHNLVQLAAQQTALLE